MPKHVVTSLALAAIVVFPLSAYAQTSGLFGPGNPIVPEECQCERQPNPAGDGFLTTAPDFGCVLQVVQNVLSFAISLAVIVMVLFLAYAGFKLIISRGKPGMYEEAKTRVLNAVIGLVVILCAWALVDFVMKSVADEGKIGPWHAIISTNGANRCIVARESESIIEGSLTLTLGDPADYEPGEGPRLNDGSGGTVSGAGGGANVNIQRAIAYATANARGRSQGQCALYVRRALGSGGGSATFQGGVGHAYQFGPSLTRAGFRAVYTGTYSSSSENLGGLRSGDVVVFQRVPGHPYGHVAIYTGQNWVSDYIQRRMSSNSANYQGGRFTIYRP